MLLRSSANELNSQFTSQQSLEAVSCVSTSALRGIRNAFKRVPNNDRGGGPPSPLVSWAIPSNMSASRFGRAISPAQLDVATGKDLSNDCAEPILHAMSDEKVALFLARHPEPNEVWADSSDAASA